MKYLTIAPRKKQQDREIRINNWLEDDSLKLVGNWAATTTAPPPPSDPKPEPAPKSTSPRPVPKA